MALFRRKMVAAIGKDSKKQGYDLQWLPPAKNNTDMCSPHPQNTHSYDAIIDLTRTLNTMHMHPTDTQATTRAILISLFPLWLLPAFTVMFSRPFPEFSCRLNAWVTALTCQWLMGPCKVVDIECADGTVAGGMGVQVERCRYLEESGCAGVCINSCKIPTQVNMGAACVVPLYCGIPDATRGVYAQNTQEFFAQHMGLPLTMTPDYETLSCTFAFSQVPPPLGEEDAFKTPCLAMCPTARKNMSVCPEIDAAKKL